MMNILLFIGETITMFALLLLCRKLFGKIGLTAWIAIAPILANIQVSKNIDIFGMTATLGNVMFASIFLAGDRLNENYGKKDANRAILIGFFSVLVYIVATQFMIIFKPSDSDMVHEHMVALFSIAPRICFASTSRWFLSSVANIYIFDKMRKKEGTKRLWLRNNISTIIANCAENFGFAFIAFGGVYSMKDILYIILTTSILEIIIAVFDTPFCYLSKINFFKKGDEPLTRNC